MGDRAGCQYTAEGEEFRESSGRKAGRTRCPTSCRDRMNGSLPGLSSLAGDAPTSGPCSRVPRSAAGQSGCAQGAECWAEVTVTELPSHGNSLQTSAQRSAVQQAL